MAPVADDATGLLVAGKYRLGSLLGAGGMGRVYSATDTVTGRVVAFKLTRPLDPSGAERFLREARALARVRHPHVVELFDAGLLADGRGYLAQRMLAGEDVCTALERRGRLPLDEALEIACAVLAALCAVHRAGLVHRDIKTSNVFLERDPRRGIVPTLLDFGIAREDGSRATVAGQAVGTPGCMAPEQAMGRAVDARTDVFAVGILLLECLTGTNPLEGAWSGESLARAVAPAAHLALHRVMVLARYGKPLTDALFAMLAEDPDGRPRTAAAALGSLLDAAAETLPSGAVARLRLTTTPFLVVAPEEALHPDEPSRVRMTPLARVLDRWAVLRPWLPAAMAAALAAGAALAWLARRPAPPPAPRTDPIVLTPTKAPAARHDAPVVAVPVDASAAIAPPVVRRAVRPPRRALSTPAAAPRIGARGAPILAP